MNEPQARHITQLLESVNRGDQEANQALWSLIYNELHSLAERQMATEKPGRTMQATALVHEAYMRLLGGITQQWENRRHFFAAAANAMRQILVDDARRRSRLKRGGGQRPGELLEGSAAIFDQDPAEVLGVDEVLERLKAKDVRKADIVQLRYFAGMTVNETAAVLGVSSSTVEKEWRIAKAWLYREMSKEDTRNE